MAHPAGLQIAVTTLHHKSLHFSPQAIPDKPPGTLQQHPQGQNVSQGQSAAALPRPAAGNSPPAGSDKASKTAAKAAELALKREDAELSQRAASERRNLPSNVEGFKYGPSLSRPSAVSLTTMTTCLDEAVAYADSCCLKERCSCNHYAEPIAVVQGHSVGPFTFTSCHHCLLARPQTICHSCGVTWSTSG